MMASPEVEELLWSEDGEFERQIKHLSMTQLLELVASLQRAMAEEQRLFDRTSHQLQLASDPTSPEYQQLSATLCQSQLRLARLCTRNMRCFTQQAIYSKKDQWMITDFEASDESGSSPDESYNVIVEEPEEEDMLETRPDFDHFVVHKVDDPSDYQVFHYEDQRFYEDKELDTIPEEDEFFEEDEELYNLQKQIELEEEALKKIDSETQQLDAKLDNLDLSKEEPDSQVNSKTLELNIPPDTVEEVAPAIINTQLSPSPIINKPDKHSAADVISSSEPSNDSTTELSPMPLNGTSPKEVEVIIKPSNNTILVKKPQQSSLIKSSESAKRSPAVQINGCAASEENEEFRPLAGKAKMLIERFNNNSKEVEIKVHRVAKKTVVVNNLKHSIHNNNNNNNSNNNTNINNINNNNVVTKEAEKVVLKPPLKENLAPKVPVVVKEVLKPETTTNNEEFIRVPRSSTKDWNMTPLLNELYKLDYNYQLPNKPSSPHLNIEGYLDLLPCGRRKVTYWNPWKKKYFRAQDGFLFIHDSQQSQAATMKLQLAGSCIEVLESRMLGIDDKKGHYVVVRALEDGFEKWITTLQSHCAMAIGFSAPLPPTVPNNKKVILIDLGSCSIRAGVLMESGPSLPQLFFPSICATNRASGKKLFGFESLNPSVRAVSDLSFPILPSAKITKHTMDVDTLPSLLSFIFSSLAVTPEDYKIELCIPRRLSAATLTSVASLLLEKFKVRALHLTHQAVAVLHAYNASSGIVVDVGERVDVVPVTDGYIVESGVSRFPHGGRRALHHFKHCLAQHHVCLESTVESFLARYLMENSCFTSNNFKHDLSQFNKNPSAFELWVDVEKFGQPWPKILVDQGRFQAPEGLFTPEMWGLDQPGLAHLVHKAIRESSMDVRREMARSIYISGGASLIPGFTERLELELDKLTPATISPKVHAAPWRYHMAYIGACVLAASDAFSHASISRESWLNHGNESLQKWNI